MKLTEQETNELNEKITAGNITKSCRNIKQDWFNIVLKSGRRACGSYKWGYEGYTRLNIYEKEGQK